MALVLNKSVLSKSAPILKCMKGRNVAFWMKKSPTLTGRCSLKTRGFSNHRAHSFFSWPQMIVRQMQRKEPSKQCVCCAAIRPRSASYSTFGTRRLINSGSPMQRSRSLDHPNATRACSKKGQQGPPQQSPPGPGDAPICAMGPCNCPWPGGCPPPGFCQQASCTPMMPMGPMGMGCCAQMPQCSPSPQCPFPPAPQCPCCGGGSCQACGPCLPCGACGACAMPAMPMAGGMPPQGTYGTWGPCGGPMCPQGVPCPFPCPCNPGGQAGPGQQDPKKMK